MSIAAPYLRGYLAFERRADEEAWRLFRTAVGRGELKKGGVTWTEEGDVKGTPELRWRALARQSVFGPHWIRLRAYLPPPGPTRSDMRIEYEQLRHVLESGAAVILGRGAAVLTLGLTLLATPLAEGQRPRGTRGPASVHEGRTAPSDEAIRRNNLGVGLMDAGTRDPKYLAEAVREFDAALALAPGYRTARLNLGVALYYAGDTQRSAATLDQVLVEQAESPHAHYVLGLVREYAGQHDAAARHFRHVTEQDATDPDAWYHLGFCLSRTGKHDEAIAAFRRAAAITPYQRRIRYSLFMALTRAGRSAEAQTELDAFRSLDNSQIRVVEGPKNPLEYLKQGRYAETIADSVPRPASSRAPIYKDVTPAEFAAMPRAALTAATSVGAALVDADGDGRLDVYTLRAGTHALFLQRGRAPREAPLPGRARRAGSNASRPLARGSCARCSVGRSRQRRPAGTRGGRVPADRHLHGPRRTTGSRSDPALPLPANHGAAGLALADVDHDGDLDIVVAGGRRPNLLLRNNGDGTFKEMGRAAGLADAGVPSLPRVVR